MCNVISRRIRATVVFWVCVCSLKYAAYNEHAPYFHLWPLRFYYIFPHYLINGTIFEKKKIRNVKCVFWLSLQLLSATYLIQWRIKRDMIKNIYRSSCRVLFILVRFCWNLNFIDWFSKNTQIPNFMKMRSVEAEFHADRQTDGQS